MLETELAALRAAFAVSVSAAERDAVARSIDEVMASGQAELAAAAGSLAPHFDLPDTHGVMQSSQRLLARGPLVVVFYRGIWCPYCNADLRAVEEVADQVRELGASLVAISGQTPKVGARFKRANQLSFPVLSDDGGKVTQAFGLRWTLSADARQTLARFGVSLARYQGYGDTGLPIPARYVLARDGVIAYADVDPNYTRRADPLDLLVPLAALQRT